MPNNSNLFRHTGNFGNPFPDQAQGEQPYEYQTGHGPEPTSTPIARRALADALRHMQPTGVPSTRRRG